MVSAASVFVSLSAAYPRNTWDTEASGGAGSQAATHRPPGRPPGCPFRPHSGRQLQAQPPEVSAVGLPGLRLHLESGPRAHSTSRPRAGASDVCPGDRERRGARAADVPRARRSALTLAAVIFSSRSWALRSEFISSSRRACGEQAATSAPRLACGRALAPEPPARRAPRPPHPRPQTRGAASGGVPLPGHATGPPSPPLTWEMPDSNSSGFSPLGFTILALELNMAFCKHTSPGLSASQRPGPGPPRTRHRRAQAGTSAVSPPGELGPPAQG